MDRATSDLRVRDRAPRGRDRRRHRRDFPHVASPATSRAGSPSSGSPFASVSSPSRRSALSSSSSGSCRPISVVCHDPSPHRSRGRPAPLPGHRDPRLEAASRSPKIASPHPRSPRNANGARSNNRTRPAWHTTSTRSPGPPPFTGQSRISPPTAGARLAMRPADIPCRGSRQASIAV